jgi:uncharacterized protein YigA (DUF484 family)
VHQDVMMRTTLSIDQDLYEIALAIARDRRQSLSAVVNQLLRNGLTRSRARGHVLTSNILALTLALLMAKAVTDGAANQTGY